MADVTAGVTAGATADVKADVPADVPAQLGEDELLRYSRQLVLPQVGLRGQRRLAAASVLVVGAGGLGSPALLYLAAAGVGRIGVADGDAVELSNLQRQVLHATPDVGRPKVASARDRLLALNPGVTVETFAARVDAAAAAALVPRFDVVVAGLDNAEGRYVLNDACVAAGRPLVEAGILGFEGFLTTIVPGTGPCFRCIFPEPPAPGSVPGCAESGVLGPLAGVMGSLQAAEAIKLILGQGRPLVGRILTVDLLEGAFRVVRWSRDPQCATCGGVAP